MRCSHSVVTCVKQNRTVQYRRKLNHEFIKSGTDLLVGAGVQKLSRPDVLGLDPLDDLFHVDRYRVLHELLRLFFVVLSGGGQEWLLKNVLVQLWCANSFPYYVTPSHGVQSTHVEIALLFILLHVDE